MDLNSIEFCNTLINAPHAGIVYVYDLALQRNVFVNKRWMEEFGYTPQETQTTEGNFLVSILHPEDVATVLAHHAALARDTADETITIEYRVQRKDGRYAWLSSKDRVFARSESGRATQIQGFAHDITRQKDAEQEQTASELRFRAMVQFIPDAVFIASRSGYLLEVNDAACAQLGYTRAELLALKVFDLVAPERRSGLPQRMNDSSERPPLVESIHLRKDGLRVPVETVVVPMTLHGQPAFLGVARDITERKRQEEDLRRESILREAIIEHAVEGICVCEDIPQYPGIFFSTWNNKMVEISGYTVEEINQLGWYQTVYKDDETQARAADRMARMRKGEHLEAEEWIITRKDDAKRTLLISTTVLMHVGDTPKVLGVMHDITDRVRMQRQIQDGQRLEAIGRLAGAVAHDFNNVLAAILGGASLLSEDTSFHPGHQEILEDIVNSATRGADLTKQLLMISRRQRTELNALDLGKLADNTLRLVSRLLPSSVKIESSLLAGCYVKGDQGMLDQVVMNLALNARDAMPHGGLLKVTCMSTSDGNIALEVTDTGMGISPATLPHVFEPFFTTKALGQGTGLGLATVYGIVAQHGGTVSVQTMEGVGTCFTVLIPVCEAPTETKRLTPSATEGRTLTILLLEDQPLVQRTINAMLTRRGHSVLLASTVDEARRHWAAHKDEISVLLTDMALDSGNMGTAVAAEFQAQRPKLPVVFMSGYDEVLSTLPLEQGLDFLQKPFQAAELYKLLERRFPVPSE